MIFDKSVIYMCIHFPNRPFIPIINRIEGMEYTIEELAEADECETPALTGPVILPSST